MWLSWKKGSAGECKNTVVNKGVHFCNLYWSECFAPSLDSCRWVPGTFAERVQLPCCGGWGSSPRCFWLLQQSWKYGAKHSSYLKICRPGQARVCDHWFACVFWVYAYAILVDQPASVRDGVLWALLLTLVLNAKLGFPLGWSLTPHPSKLLIIFCVGVFDFCPLPTG